MPMSLSGFSKNFITLIPGIYSFILGAFIVLFLSPITSELSKYYETIKKNINTRLGKPWLVVPGIR